MRKKQAHFKATYSFETFDTLVKKSKVQEEMLNHQDAVIAKQES